MGKLLAEKEINGKKLVLIEPQTRKEIKQFTKLPFKIYKDDPLWVPHLNIFYKDFIDIKNNPQFKGEGRLNLVYMDDEPVARSVVGINRFSNEALKAERGLFTLFEFIEDYDVFCFLMDNMIQYSKEKNMDEIWGPLSPDFSDNFRGCLIKGFDLSPFFMQPYNPKYYPEFYEKYGFTSYEKMFVMELDLTKEPSKSIERVVNYTKKKYDITVEQYSHDRYDEFVRIIHEISSNAFDDEFMKKYPGFVSPSLEDWYKITEDFKPLIQPEFILFFYMKDEPVGFVIGLPDYNDIIRKIKGKLFPFGFFRMLLGKNKITRGRTFDLAVKKEHHGKGINAVIVYEIFKRGRKLGYTAAETGTMHSDNVHILNTVDRIGGNVYKEYNHYGMKI